MRPRELTLEGFRSYRTRSTFDFRDRRLIGIVGPIGAGKSSILDAIAFALYGKTPAFERDTRSLIHQLADLAQVQLVFEVDGQIWRVTRAIRRRGQSGHKLERLDADGPDAVVLGTIEQEKATRSRVAELLGMDFDAFRRSVLLAQNRFADLLKASAGGRDAVLKGAFGYERFDAALVAAKRRLAVAEVVLGGLAEEGARVRDARAAVDAADAAATETAASAAALEVARPGVEALRAAIDAADTALAALAARVDALGRVGAMLPEPDHLATTLAEAIAAGAAAAGAAGAAEDTEDARRAAEAERDALEEVAGDLREFGALVAAMEACGRELEAAETNLGRTTAEAATEAARLAAAVLARGSAEAARITAEERARDDAASLSDADTALHDARHREMAGSLRRELVRGEPCPVCAQVVATVPTGGRAAGVRAAEKAAAASRRRAERAAAAREAAVAAEAAATATVEAATATHATAGAAVQSASGAVATTSEALDLIKSDLVDRLGAGDPRGLLEEREAARAAAEAALRDATAAATDARTALDAARAAEKAAAATLTGYASVLSGAWGLFGAPRDITSDPDDLRSSFDEIGRLIDEERTTCRSDEREANAGRAASADELVNVLDGLGLGPTDDFTEALVTARERAASSAERLRGLRESIAAAADLERRVTAAQANRDLTARLVSDLQPSRFLAWVLATERQALADLGSVHLDALTDGAYRFADDDTFAIADENAGGMTRSAESLSGGETFLASLALALALAEMVTRGGGRLDAFFLDEGFGSLDPEHLERAMDGIGRLVAEDRRRLVVVVSHVEDMKLLLEDLIVLDKDPRTGDTTIISGATPG